MFERAGAVAICAALVALAACSGGSDSGTTTTELVDAVDAVDAESTSSEPTTDSAVDTGDGGTGDDGSGDDGSGDDGSDGDDGVSDTVDPVDPDADVEYVPAPIGWEEFNDQVEVGTLEVPVDYGDPDGPGFELVVARHRALDTDERIGTLVINPGGPGSAGIDYAMAAGQLFDTELLERFDILAWDPRGTGESSPAIDCIDDYDTYFTAVDSTPRSDAERQETIALAERFADACIDNNASIIDHVGTNDSARDVDSIRRSLGEDEISYFGFSYGSELGATWATMFPETVRAIVLDGAADPDADALESLVQQQRGFEQALETFLARCGDDEACAFDHDGDPRGAFVDLMEQLDAEPLEVESDRPPVNRDVALLASVQAMYSNSSWPVLERALASAQGGDGTGLLDLHDSYYRRRSEGSYPNFLEAFQVISCADTPDRLSVEESDAQVPALREAAPLLVPAGSMGSYFCTFFPPAHDPRIAITGDGAGPIVVIGTTGDPATPLDSTRAMVEHLDDGRLVIVDADQHLGYGVNRCVIDIVNRYLVDLEAPDSGTECT